MPEYPELAGQIVLVTGAARGIGRGIALAFAAAGSIVIVNDLEQATAESTVAEIERASGTAVAAVADVGNPVAADSMVCHILEQFGSIDVLVNNACINPTAPFLELKQDAWENTQRTNLWALFHCGQPIAREMAKRGRGSIVVIGSPACNEAYENQAPYAVAKAGLQMLARSLAWELGAFGVRTNIVHPGWIETELNREYLWSDTATRDRVLHQIPTRRTGQPADVAGAVMWLCSDAASYVNGAALTRIIRPGSQETLAKAA